ncbi:hypothetical protein JMJ55_14910 [Belnapia sp. T6]|uniref:Uncharacterized protein n=1 Tax=Belnapia mucosa TaxID=2804532 RepID=A0ABS1V8F4_9PROT|nr:hypothetical protein [Belnapia mucosa]MBL6456623.1 hypothetical protein [Belnapia mucosa]
MLRPFRRTRYVSHLGDEVPPREHRGAVLPEEAADAGGLRDRVSMLGGLLLMLALVAVLTFLARLLLAP